MWLNNRRSRGFCLVFARSVEYFVFNGVECSVCCHSKLSQYCFLLIFKTRKSFTLKVILYILFAYFSVVDTKKRTYYAHFSEIQADVTTIVLIFWGHYTKIFILFLFSHLFSSFLKCIFIVGIFFGYKFHEVIINR